LLLDFKRFFRKGKNEDDFAGITEDSREDDVLDEKSALKELGDIDFGDDDAPEDRAKTVKKKAILLAGGGVALFALMMVIGNYMGSGTKTAKQDASLNGGVSASTPADHLPDNYSDINKMQQKQGNAHQRNGEGTRNAPTTTQGTSQVSARTPSSGTGSSVVTAAAVPTISAATPSMGTGTASQESHEAETRLREEQQAYNSALAFKVAQNVSLGNAPNAEIGALPNASASNGAATLLPTSFAYQDNGFLDSGSYILGAGSVIQATLLTGVTSDIANTDVVAQVRQNIYDSLTGQHLLIPQGSRLIGKSSASGGKRIGVVFYRVILPSGASFMLPDQQAIDGVGFPGLLDRYDDHRSSAYRSGFMSALLAAGVQSLTGNTSGNDERSPGQEAVSGAVASILSTGQRFVDQDLNRGATIEIRPGFQFSVFINQDLAINEYGGEI
jgi:type IV secretory pathway VirB10-like protein